MTERGAIGRVETERLVFGPISLTDADELFALDSDPEVMRYITGGKATPREDVEELIPAQFGSRWMGHERSAGEFVGWFGLMPTGAGEYEVGYRLRRSFWGLGLATEGTRALIGAGFQALDATRIWAQTMAVNLRSRAVMERCGLRYVRTLHLEWDDPIEGTDRGEVEYEVLRADWEA